MVIMDALKRLENKEKYKAVSLHQNTLFYAKVVHLRINIIVMR